MVSRVPHDTDKSAIHTIILYVIFSVMTIKMLGVFRILCISLKIYLRGVKCGCMLCTSFLISHRDILCSGIMLSKGILSGKSEFVDKLRLFVMPAGVLHFVAFCFDFGL